MLSAGGGSEVPAEPGNGSVYLQADRVPTSQAVFTTVLLGGRCTISGQGC